MSVDLSAWDVERIDLSALGVNWYCYLDEPDAQVPALWSAIGTSDDRCPEHGRSGWLRLPAGGAPPPPWPPSAEGCPEQQKTPGVPAPEAFTDATDLESARGRFPECA